MRIKNFSKGAAPKGGSVVATSSQRIQTSVVKLGATKYAQRGKKKR